MSFCVVEETRFSNQSTAVMILGACYGLSLLFLCFFFFVFLFLSSPNLVLISCITVALLPVLVWKSVSLCVQFWLDFNCSHLSLLFTPACHQPLSVHISLFSTCVHDCTCLLVHLWNVISRSQSNVPFQSLRLDKYGQNPQMSSCAAHFYQGCIHWRLV